MELITLQNRNGLVAQFTSYGARWVSMFTPDRNGNVADILLGFDTLSCYQKAHEAYHGAIVGRVCGRVANARFFRNGHMYKLAENDVYGQPIRNHLHGGIHALHNRFWHVDAIRKDESGEESVIFSTVSPDGEEGYPGNLFCKVTYTLRHDNVLTLSCEATCDKETPVNITNHAFFNLNGHEEKNIENHILGLNSSSIIECDENLLPTGKILSVTDSDLDFHIPKKITSSLHSKLFGIDQTGGFSLAYVLNTNATALHKAAELSEEKSGRLVSIYTNQSSLQVYTGYFMDGSDIGKYGIPYEKSAGIALEPQGYPDALSHPEFPSIFIGPDTTFHHYTEYHFELL